MTRRKEQRTEPTRKQVRVSRRAKQQQRYIYIVLAAIVGLIVLVLAIGVTNNLFIQPRSPVAVVNGEAISTDGFQRRFRYQAFQLQNQLVQLSQLQSQFGDSGSALFGQQIQQIQSMLQSPDSLGFEVLEQMITEAIVRQEAEKQDVVVTNEEVDQHLQSIVASRMGYVSSEDSTATVIAAGAATETAELWTATPTSTVTAIPSVTATSTPTVTPSPDDATPEATPDDATPEATPDDGSLLTPEPTPTSHVMTMDEYTTGLSTFETGYIRESGFTLAEFRVLVRTDALQQKLQDEVMAGVPTVEEQVHARHILIVTREPTPTPVPTAEPTPLPEGDEPPTPTATLEPAATLTPQPEGAEPPAPTETPTPTPAPRSDEEALARARQVVERLLAGESFEDLAAEFSDGPTAVSGGDLGWFGRGRMVVEFEDAAFSLAVGEFSEPVKSPFGYHIIEVVERDSQRPLSAEELTQRQQAEWDDWLTQKKGESQIERRLTPDKIPSIPVRTF